MIKQLIINTLKNDLDHKTSRNIKYSIIFLGIIKAILMPYTPVAFQFVSACILVTIAVIFGRKKWGLLATGWSVVLFVIAYFLGYRFTWIELVGAIGGLLLISIGFGLILDYLIELITQLYSTQDQLETRNQELDLLYQRLNTKISKARQLHQQFLPDYLPELEKIIFGSYYQPSDVIGGDFYNTIKMRDKVIFFVSDVRGHSLDGALTNIFIRENINNYLFQNSENDKFSPQQIMNYVVEKYKNENFPDDHFISLLLGVIDTSAMEVSFCNAGFQIPPLVISEAGEIEELNQGGLPISSVTANNLMFEMDMFNYEERKIKLMPGQTILITTDGLIEEKNNQQQYGLKQVKKLVQDKFYLPPEFLINHIINDFRNFSNPLQPQDDITLLAIKGNSDEVAHFKTELANNHVAITEKTKKVMDFMDDYVTKANKMDLKIAINELLINSLEHGNQSASDKVINLEVKIHEKYVKVIVADQGKGFNWKENLGLVLDFEDYDVEEFDHERGRGIKLVNTASDYLWYNQQGNQAYILKLRNLKEE